MIKFAVFWVILCAAGVLPGSSAVLSFALEKPVGFAWYDLEHTGPSEEFLGNTFRPMVRSELNFPLDPFRLAVGLSGTRGADSAGRGGFRTVLQAWTSAGPAFFRMRDEDWVGARASEGASSSKALNKFSDTYSDAETWQAGGSLHHEVVDFRLFGLPLAVGLGLGGSYYAFEVFGVEGRQRDESGDWREVSAYHGVKVLTYWTFTARTVVSLRARERLLGLLWDARLHPLIHSRGYDDHILRSKEVEMECWGAGAVLEAALPLGPRREAEVPPRWLPYLRFELDRAFGDMTQTYYANSTDTPEDETGRSEKGIRTSVNHWLIGIGVRASLGR